MAVDPVRDAAIGVLMRVATDDAYLNIALDKTLRRKKQISGRGRRFMAHLVFGTVRHQRLCDHALRPLLHQPLEDLPLPIRLVLRMGVFQSLFCANVTFPAMVHTSVDLAKRRGHAGTARLVNAVLKRAPQTIEDIVLPDPEADKKAYLGLRYSVADWMTDLLMEELGEAKTEEICAAWATEAPNTLRVNTLLTDRNALLQALEKTGVSAMAHEHVADAVEIVEGPVPVRGKLFQGGHFMVQDTASMLPPLLLEPKPSERILDLCAAPGGKATHLAQLTQNQSTVVAVDIHPPRLGLVRENIERLGADSVLTVAADGLHPPFHETFDRVLVDGPCSGLGTVRRHPDLKWRIQSNAIDRLGAEQEGLLRSAVGLCKNGGLIVYSVCTFTRRETEEVVLGILKDGKVTLEDGPEWLNRWKINQGQYRILPQAGLLDGYFLTRLRKVS